MKKSINEKYIQKYDLRNDIYRKFERQFRFIFYNSINLDEGLYIRHGMEKYEDALDVFMNGVGSDIRFLIGFTGIGKTTLLEQCFSYKTLGAKQIDPGTIIIPNSLDGIKIHDEGYSREIDEQIKNTICILIKKIYKAYEEMILEEGDDIIEFIASTRTNIVPTLSLEELGTAGYSINQKKIQKGIDKWPVEFASSLLKYVVNKKDDIKQLVFIVDDLETLSQHKLCYLIESYLKIYDCMHNTENKPSVKLLVSLRPHSFRFLKEDLKYHYISAYGNFFQNQAYRLIKDEIPNVKEIFIARFEWAAKQTPKPGNQATWDKAKEVFYEIIDGFDDNLVQMIVDLCHMNIRSVTDCFQMILSNRVWCQEFNEYTQYPSVKREDYRFDIVNVVRTLACGESSVYMGQKETCIERGEISAIQDRPVLDDSVVFIPNLLIDIHTRECDVLPAIIIYYLKGYFESAGPRRSGLQSEFLTKGKLVRQLCSIFNEHVEEDKIREVVEYLFENRIIRKSIINNDDDLTFYCLNDGDYLYLTRKGERLLEMLESDSVLLEIYREDICREYLNEDDYKSSAELVMENKRGRLFEDILTLTRVIYFNEDQYQRYVAETGNRSAFYEIKFPLTMKVMDGVYKSLTRAQNLEKDERNKLMGRFDELRTLVQERICEMATGLR